MNTKPILFWPRARSEISHHLDRDDDVFLVVDTNSAYELQKLYKIRADTPIFDPFPNRGEHYQQFIEHVGASDCRCHIVGIELCQEVLQALKDPLLARSSIEEIFSAIKTAGQRNGAPGTQKAPKSFVRGSTISRTIDWSSLNWATVGLLAALAFMASLIGNVLSPNDSLIAAVVAAVLFAADRK